MQILATEVSIETAYITLGQLLKEENVISTGGQAKWYLRENEVLVNQEHDDRRGRKLYPGDVVALPTGERFVVNGTGVDAE
jgi:S4 domain protein YaaA